MTAYTITPPPVALAGAATKTVVGVNAGSTKRFLVKEVHISTDGIDATKIPIEFQLLRHTTAGTSTAGTNLENEEVREAFTGSSGYNYTVEPTAGDVLRRWYITPAGATWAFQFMPGDEPVVGTSGRISVRAITQTGVTCNVLVTLSIEE
jgi:hypothetical protein